MIRNKITKAILQLEKAHESLRTHTLTQWSEGSLPGPHLQTLLEMLLAARRVLPREGVLEQM